ncbi:MAG: ATP-binding protein [Acidimicrobiaceae bacterium]|nr:ATP-binding protein [Acidimicrobiaceae bacterium]
MSESLLGPGDLNPFSPDFGQTPAHLVGRDGLTRSLGTGLASGPTARNFTSLLMGPRGSGKTVVLTEMEQRAAASGWIVISLDASTPGILDRVRQSVTHTWTEYEGADAADPDRDRPGRWSGTTLGPVGLQRSVLSEVRPEWDARHLLTKLAEHAQQADTSVLMTIDEMQSGDRNELRRLSADLQHITKRAHLPLAVMSAGLSEMNHTLLLDKKMTFFRRCARFDMPGLSAADIIAGLRIPVAESGGSIDSDALDFAAQACGSLPYEMQLIGYHAWTIAGAPRHPIQTEAVRHACDLASQSVLDDLVVPAWHDQSRSHQEFLGAVADAGGQARPEQLAACLDYNFVTLSEISERLIACGYLAEANDGTLSLTDLMPVGAIQGIMESRRRFQIAGGPSTGSSDGRGKRVSSDRCEEYMPRAKAHCVLPRGHSGGHRSGARRPRRRQ